MNLKKSKLLILILLLLAIASTVYINFLMREKSLYRENLKKVEGELKLVTEEKEKLDSVVLDQNNAYEEYVYTSSKLSDEIKEKNKELIEKDNELQEYITQINDLEIELSSQKGREELLAQIEILEEEIKRNKDFLYYWPQASDFYMLNGSKIIWTGMGEEQVIELFGEPQTINTGFTETTINSYDDRPTKKYEYEDYFVELMYISENHEHGYWVRLIVAKTDKLRTIRGISIGDTEEDLLEKYPYLEVTFVKKDDENEKLYVMDNFMVRDSLAIHVKDGVIIEISVNFIYD